ncbi:MAG: hypothetical protein CVU11_07650 [Bacteroidetes bacterium HGW-Bacteroidetes-6]|jgi:hypothetical protein|nr:MAG: hypothetical protein CVU11_07650 [Bacteroidetes bacterium HGW-Bacteroidetes-6]
MENDKTTLDILSEFAKQTGRTIISSETEYPGNAIHPVDYHKRSFCIPFSDASECFLAGISNPKSYSDNAFFFGVFFTVSAPLTSNFIISKKDILDRIAISGRKSILKTGTASFDSMFLIKGNDRNSLLKLIPDSYSLELCTGLLNLRKNFKMGLNICNLDFAAELKGKSTFGIFTYQGWILDFDFLENWLRKTVQFKKHVLGSL